MRAGHQAKVHASNDKGPAAFRQPDDYRAGAGKMGGPAYALRPVQQSCKMRMDTSPTRLRRRQGRQPMKAQALIQAANHHIIQMVTP
jgi:hypothetical protein